MHERYVGYVAVSKDNLLNALFENQLFEFFFRIDRDTVRVTAAAQRGRIAAVFDVRDLRRSERHDFVCGIVSEADIEGVKISTCGTHDQDSLPVGAGGWGFSALRFKFFRGI